MNSEVDYALFLPRRAFGVYVFLRMPKRPLPPARREREVGDGGGGWVWRRRARKRRQGETDRDSRGKGRWKGKEKVGAEGMKRGGKREDKEEEINEWNEERRLERNGEKKKEGQSGGRSRRDENIEEPRRRRMRLWKRERGWEKRLHCLLLKRFGLCERRRHVLQSGPLSDRVQF